MMFPSRTVAVLVALLSLTSADNNRGGSLRATTAGKRALADAKADLSGEDASFWDRMLQDDSSMPPAPTMPAETQPPVVPPTLPPEPAPTMPPVMPPTDAPVPDPTMPPVMPPTDPPVPDPTTPPVMPPTDAPVSDPTMPPVMAPTDAPVPDPTMPPVMAPTDAPVPDPTMPPVMAPTEPPVIPPTDAPVPDPTMPPTDPPVVPPTEPPVAPPTDAPTEAPAECPVRVEIECIDAVGTACSEIAPPESGSGAGCVVDVSFTYTLFNDASVPEQVYSLTEIRNGVSTVLTDIPGVVPTKIMDPGESITTSTQVSTIDLCGGQNFDTRADLFTSPQIDVTITISCISDEGVECAAIETISGTPEECQLGITYTYTITNTGFADTSFVSLNRIRGGETVDLVPLLDSPDLAVGETTSVQETEEIDRCMANDFTTTTNVEQEPSVDILCLDTAFYP